MRWVTLGDYIELYEVKNTAGYDYPVVGINKNKEFMPTVANMEDVDTKKYKIISRNQFVFSGMQTGRDVCIRIGLYNRMNPSLVSPAYTIFIVKDPTILLPEFLFLYFNRFEMDRYGWFISDSSVRANLDWPRFLEIKIPLPDINEQRKIVSVWKGLRDLKAQNEAIAEPLSVLCQSYLKQLKEEYEPTEIGPYIEEINNKNNNDYIKEVMGLNVNKEFREPQSRVDRDKLSNYKILKYNQFAYVPTTDTWRCLAVALSKFKKDIVVSPIYITFEIKNEDIIIPEYLYIWLKQKETDRWARYNSWGSARENLNFDDLCRFEIPIPSIEKQQAIVNIYNCAKEAKEIANKAELLIKDICPALMRQVIGEAS